MKEKLQEYALLAEILSSISILITLVYLAIQTQQNTDAIQASVRNDLLQHDFELTRVVIEHPELNKRAHLSKVEEVKVLSFLFSVIRSRETQYLQYRNGNIDEATWFSYRQALRMLLFDSSYGRSLWDLGGYDTDFRNHINDWLETLDLKDSEVMLPSLQP